MHRKKSKQTFTKSSEYKPRNKKEERLIDALVLLKTNKQVADFLRDLLTLAEIEEFANRLEIAYLLAKGMPYKKIADQTGVSTTTVTRVAYWLFQGCGGYKRVIDNLG